MKLIIGLGNPGKEYEKTRHNIGWRVINSLAQELNLETPKEEKKFKALVSKNTDLILAKPLTFMNRSGESVQAIAEYFKIDSTDILIIHDEIDLPLGEIKLQEGKNSAGHKGVQSIIDHLKGKDFKRLRIGIKPEELKIETEKFVIQKFTPEEEEIIEGAIEKAVQEIKTTL